MSLLLAMSRNRFFWQGKLPPHASSMVARKQAAELVKGRLIRVSHVAAGSRRGQARSPNPNRPCLAGRSWAPCLKVVGIWSAEQVWPGLSFKRIASLRKLEQRLSRIALSFVTRAALWIISLVWKGLVLRGRRSAVERRAMISRPARNSVGSRVDICHRRTALERNAQER